MVKHLFLALHCISLIPYDTTGSFLARTSIMKQSHRSHGCLGQGLSLLASFVACKTCTLALRCLATRVIIHDDGMAWEVFQHYWPFVRGIHQLCGMQNMHPGTEMSAYKGHHTWWWHGMGSLSALLALCEGNPPALWHAKHAPWHWDVCLQGSSYMMMAWHGKSFSITGPLWGESTSFVACKTCTLALRCLATRVIIHDDGMAWEVFQHYWPFVRGIHQLCGMQNMHPGTEMSGYKGHHTWWWHGMGSLSALLALCEGNPPVTGGFTSQRASKQGFAVFFVISIKCI